LLRDGGLDLRAPAAGGDPESIDGNDGNAWGLAESEEGESEEEKGGGGKEEGGLPAESEEVAECEAGAGGE